MKILLTSLNARYSHTALAARLIREALAREGVAAELLEATINTPSSFVAESIYLASPDLLAFSVYIWNADAVLRLIRRLRPVLPHALFVLGGPEAEDRAEELLRSGAADLVLAGEGEANFPALVRAVQGGLSFETIPGAFFLHNGGVVQTPRAPFCDLGLLPLPYRPDEALEHRIVYYEASRGCPYRCSYCRSANDPPLRLRPLLMVFEDLSALLARRPMQVKFVDRTFNADRERALAIWRHLAESDNGTTGFQFEITAELLDEEQLQYLSSVRPGLFQFEIGVQSSFPPALAAVRRPCRLDSLSHAVRRLGEAGNIHRHLDLIAGLPLEGFSDFRRSFEFVFSLRPEQLQLGFLKVLAGAPIAAEAKRYGILFAPDPPYEVLVTGALSHGELLRIKRVEAAVELYYNSGRFDAMLQFALPLFPTAFSLFEALGDQLADGERHDSGWYHTAFLRAVSQRLGFDCSALLAPRCRFDLAAVSKPNTVPGWARVPYPKERIAALCPNDRPSADHFLGVFPGGLCGRPEPEVLVRFDYARRDLRGRAAAHVLGPFAP